VVFLNESGRAESREANRPIEMKAIAQVQLLHDQEVAIVNIGMQISQHLHGQSVLFVFRGDTVVSGQGDLRSIGNS
jgi:hypothetical protein